MLRIRSLRVAIGALTACFLSACGGGGMTNLAPPPQQAAQTPATTSATTRITASETVAIQTLKIPNVPPPTGSWSFDGSAVDPARHAYYLADRTNASLDVVDTAATKLVAQIKGFVGFTGNNSFSGPNGVVPIPGTPLVY